MGLFEVLFNKWFILLLGIVFMFVGLLPEYTMKAVRLMGKMGWAEQSVGRGGTYQIWKLIGILAPIAAMIYFFTPSIQFKTDKSQPQQNSYEYQDDYNYDNYNY